MKAALLAIGALALSGVGYLVFSLIGDAAADAAKDAALRRPSFAARRSRHRALMNTGIWCAMLSFPAAFMWFATATSGRESDAGIARVFAVLTAVLPLAAGGLLTTWWRRAGRDSAAAGPQDDLATSKPPEFSSSLRVIAGSQEGLRDGWHQGEVSVHPGRLEFVVGLQVRDGLRAAFSGPSPPISVPVREVATKGQRRLNKGEMWNVNADSEFLELTTDTATLEWTVPPRRLTTTLARLKSGM